MNSAQSSQEKTSLFLMPARQTAGFAVIESPMSEVKIPFQINVVLVRTIYDSNIGASSRAMANMGAERLILIAPQCEVTFAAQQAAATGQKALSQRSVYNTWDDFFANEPEGIRLSFTARDGRGRQVQDCATVLNWLKDNHPIFTEPDGKTLPVYLIFGPEDWGLSTEDLELTHYSCSIPIFGENTSLNLAQAVLLALFIVRSTWGGERTKFEGQVSQKRARQSVFPEKILQTWLEEMGFTTSNRRINAFTVLKRLMLHNVPTQKELKILETVLHQGVRKLREYNDLRKQMGLPAIDHASDILPDSDD